MTAKRVDANQGLIIKCLRTLGCKVHITSDLGKGFPDLVCAVGNKLILVEIKNGALSPSKQKLTPCEAEFHLQWQEHVFVINSVEQAVKLVSDLRR